MTRIDPVVWWKCPSEP